MPPNLLAHYPYLWEPTVVRQAIDTAWISASSGGHSFELLVPAAPLPDTEKHLWGRLSIDLQSAGHLANRIGAVSAQGERKENDSGRPHIWERDQSLGAR